MTRLQPDAAQVVHLLEEVDDPADVHDYVVRRLREVPAPAMDAGQVAAAVLALPGGQEEEEGRFLLARVITAQLRASPVDTSRPGWQQQLSTSVEMALDRDLDALPARIRGEDRLPAAGFDLLAALAWAQGGGLPDDIWPAGRHRRLRRRHRIRPRRRVLGAGRPRAATSSRPARPATRCTGCPTSGSASTCAPGPATAACRTPSCASRPPWSTRTKRCSPPVSPPPSTPTCGGTPGGTAPTPGPPASRSFTAWSASTGPRSCPTSRSPPGTWPDRQVEAGKPFEAVGPAEDAVTAYRELAAANPAYLPDLAGALTNLGIRYSEVGRRADAVPPAEEAVTLLPGPGRRQPRLPPRPRHAR